MEKEKIKRLLKVSIATFVSIVLTGLGVTLIIQANLGSDAINVFVDGLCRTFHVSLGTSSRIYNGLALIIALILNRKDIGLATIVYALTTGFAIDFFMNLITPFAIGQSSLFLRLIYVIIAQLVFTFAFALLIKYRSGMNQLDAIAYGIEKRTQISFKYVRTGIDVVLLVSGFLMGGVLGIGSVITMATTGILIQYFVKVLDYFD